MDDETAEVPQNVRHQPPSVVCRPSSAANPLSGARELGTMDFLVGDGWVAVSSESPAGQGVDVPRTTCDVPRADSGQASAISHPRARSMTRNVRPDSQSPNHQLPAAEGGTNPLNGARDGRTTYHVRRTTCGQPSATPGRSVARNVRPDSQSPNHWLPAAEGGTNPLNGARGLGTNYHICPSWTFHYRLNPLNGARGLGTRQV